MDAKRATVIAVVTPAAESAGANDPSREERSWLVFRLGPHTMCASTLDVEGIIEPKPVTQLPFAPAHVLGTFIFRDQVATAISLRKKLGVGVGEDTAQGPYIVARVGGELAAFWVDEVKDVIGAQDVAWQPMPEMLRGRVFDRYTLAGEELILHTSFASLLEADAESLPARWRTASDGSRLREAAPPEFAEAQSTPGKSGDEERRQSPPGPAPRSAVYSAGSAPAHATADQPPAPQGQDESPRELQDGASTDRMHAQPAPPPAEAPVRKVRLAGTTGAESTARQGRRAIGHEAVAQAHVLKARTDRRRTAEDTRLEPGDAASRSGGAAPAWPETPRRDGTEVAQARDARATASPVPIYEPDPRDYRVGRDPVPANSHGIERKPIRPRALIAILLAFAALLGATAILWTDGGSGSSPAAERSDNRVRGDIVADTPPHRPASGTVGAEPPVPPAPAESASGALAPSKPEQTTRIATVETEVLSLTIERPAKGAKRAAVSSGKIGPERSAAPSEERQRTMGSVVHVVVRGDTLWDIARKHLGNPFRYPELVRLSGIRNPDLIHPGDIVRIRVNEKRR